MLFLSVLTSAILFFLLFAFVVLHFSFQYRQEAERLGGENIMKMTYFVLSRM